MLKDFFKKLSIKQKVKYLLGLLFIFAILCTAKYFISIAYYNLNPINIVYTTDKNYKDYLKVSLNSLVRNKNKHSIYNINILCVNLTPTESRYYYSYNSDKVHVNVIDMDLNTIKNVGNYEINYHVTRADLFKFFMPEIFPELNKILYLDVDTIILKDVSKLYYTNLGNKYLGVVTKCIPNHRTYQKFGKNKIKKVYEYNCGVMLYNLKKWRKNNITNQLVEAKNNDETRNLMTQKVFNEVLGPNKIKRLSPIYNVLTQWDEKMFEYCEFRRVNWRFCTTIFSSEDLFRKAVIIHYVDQNKPWKQNVPYGQIWEKYKL